MKKIIYLPALVLVCLFISPIYSANADKRSNLPAPIVEDDGIYTTQGSQLHVAWHMPISNSGQLTYEYCMVMDKNDTKRYKWNKVGTATEVTEAGLALTQGNIYYFAVRAKGSQGKSGDVGYSDGIFFDKNIPIINNILPSTNSVFLLGANIRIEVNAYDADRDVLRYQFLVDGVIVKTWNSLSVFDWNSNGFNSGSHIITCIVRDCCGAEIEKNTEIELHDPSPQEALRRVADNYSLVNDLKADVTLEYILNGKRFGDDLDIGMYYFLRPDKGKIETYTDSQRTSKVETVITSGAKMFIRSNNALEVLLNDLLDESGLTLEQFQSLNIQYNAEEFISGHNLVKSERGSDYSQNLIAIIAYPLVFNEFYSNLILTIDYYKGLVIKYELMQGSTIVKQKTEILDSMLMGNNAWVPTKIVKTPTLSTNSFVTTMVLTNISINNGLTESDFNPLAQ